MKNRNLSYVVLGILFILISVIVFVIPTEKTTTFWIAYVFTAIAFVTQSAIWKTALGKNDTLKSKFLGFPVVYIGIMYLIIQVIVLIIFTAFPSLPNWNAIIACTIVLGVSFECLITGESGRKEISRVETKVQRKVFLINELQVDVELLADTETDINTKEALQQLSEKFRFSDPISDSALVEIEKSITEKVIELKNASNKMMVIQELNSLLSERNKKCKILK